MPQHSQVNLNAARYVRSESASRASAGLGWVAWECAAPGPAHGPCLAFGSPRRLGGGGRRLSERSGGAECPGHACGCMRRGPPGPQPRRNGGETKRGAHPAGNPSQAPRSLRALTEQGAGLQRALCREGKIEPRRERERESRQALLERPQRIVARSMCTTNNQLTAIWRRQTPKSPMPGYRGRFYVCCRHVFMPEQTSETK